MININYEDIIQSLPKELYLKFEDLKRLRERPDYHPEESAYEHIRIVFDRCKQFNDYELVISALFHDITKYDDHHINPETGYPTSPGHATNGANLSRLWITHFDDLFNRKNNEEKVYQICKEHMSIKQFRYRKKNKKEILFNNPYFKELVMFTEADNMLKEFNYNDGDEIKWLENYKV